MQKPNKQSEPCPVADVAKFLQKAVRGARSTLKLGKMGLRSPLQLLLSAIFVKTKFKQKMPFPKNIYLMSFGSLG